MTESTRPPLLSTPVAVLAGSVIIAVAVYLGLRDRGSASPGQTPSPGAALGTQSATGAPPLPPGPPRSAVDAAAAVSAAKAALQEQKKIAVTKCWAPSAEVQADPASVTYAFNFGFGPDGKQITRGIAEPRGARPGMVNCMQAELPPIAIPAQGQAIGVEVELTLP